MRLAFTHPVAAAHTAPLRSVADDRFRALFASSFAAAGRRDGAHAAFEGSFIARTAEMRLAGTSRQRACSRMTSSLSAM